MTPIIIGALLIGLSLGIFGSGGSILTVPILIYLLHHGDKVAIAESLAIVGMVALVSAIPYARARHIDWRTAALFGIPGMMGTYAGAWLGAFASGAVQLLVFAVVMLLAAISMWRRSGSATTVPTTEHRIRWPLVVAEGLGVGVLTGFVGVGGGFLIVPALVILGGLTMRRAVATSLVIIALKSGAGFWKSLDVLASLDLRVDWNTIGAFASIGFVGSLLGSRLAARIDQRRLQRGFAIFLVAMALFMTAKETASLLAHHPAPHDVPPTTSTSIE